MNYKLFCILVSVFIISCSKPQVQQDIPMDGAYYTIDLDGKKETSIPLSSYFKGVRTVILETNEDCLIGSIDEIQVFDKHIYILDSNKSKSLFVFDINGKFIRKIGSIGNAPGEYIGPGDFTLDTKNRIIYLCDINNRVHKYDLDGTYLHTITIEKSDFNALFIQFYKDRLYASPLWWKKSGDNYMLLEIDPNNGQILSRLLPVKYNKGWNEPLLSMSRFFMSRVNNPPRYNQMFMDYIVSVGEEITPYIKLKSNYLTTDKDIESFRSNDFMGYSSSNIHRCSKRFNVHCFVENEEFILFRYGGLASSSFIVAFNKRTGLTELADQYINDLVYNHDRQTWLGLFSFSDSSGVYEILNTQTDYFNDFKNSIENDEIVPDLDKIDQLKKLNSESNPVIFYYEFN